MCGRFTLRTATLEELEAQTGARVAPEAPAEERHAYRARFNAAPTDEVWAVVAEAGQRVLRPMRWGFPRPGGGPTKGGLLINARVESLGAPMYRDLFRDHRGVVVADGFYEWHRKKPLWFHPPAGGLLYLGAIIEPGDPPRLVILTTPPNDDVRAVHDRMPLVVDGTRLDHWLATADRGLLVPPPAGTLVATPASPRVNTVAHDDPACLEPPAADPQLTLF